MSTTSIRRVSYSTILAAHNASELIAEYAAECSIPDAAPQVELYEAMEGAGALQCFGAYVDEELVGFASVMHAIMPHHGKRVGTVESLFVLSAQRATGAGDALLSAAEQHAAAAGCVALTYTARAGSRLEKILKRRAGCLASHSQFTRWL